MDIEHVQDAQAPVGTETEKGKISGRSVSRSCSDERGKGGLARRCTRFMTKLGAHITHLAAFGGNKLQKTSRKALGVLWMNVSPAAHKAAAAVVKAGERVLRSVQNGRDFCWKLADQVGDVKANQGAFPAAGVCVREIALQIWRCRKMTVTAFNWAAPVVSVVFLVNVVGYGMNIDYGVNVTVGNQEVAMVSAEGDFDEAALAMQEKITYIDGNQAVTISPRFSVQPVADAQELSNPEELADKLIGSSDTELINAFGVYIDGQFVGAVTDTTPIQETCDSILAKYDGGNVTNLRLTKDVTYTDGLYLAEALTDVNEIVDLLQSETTRQITYTVVQYDSPSLIADKNDISLDELMSLNPNLMTSCFIGDEVLLNRPEPFMGVEYTKTEEYSRVIDFETESIENTELYEGNTEILLQGEEGEEIVTAEITYLNGYETDRNVVGTQIVKEPVTEKIAIGAKPLVVGSDEAGINIIGNGQYAWPVAGGYISAYYGDSRNHKGMDIAAPYGTAIYAAEAGTVIMSQWYSGYGYCIQIQHDDGNVTLYGHQSKLLATVGQTVQKGEVIGMVGSTGQSTGNHCHFEVKRNGVCMNPMSYVTQ